jgi:6-phosphofructo-2-kinase
MVGLPARGKSYICKKLQKYLTWCGFNSQIFNVGNKRRIEAKDTALRTIAVAPSSSSSCSVSSHDSYFFDANNAEAAAVREKLAADTLEELIDWLHGGGKVAIHDATNSTYLRRKTLTERVSKEIGVKCFFIESICSDPELLEQNISMKLKGPDYINMEPKKAIEDFKNRIKNYEKVYQTISDEEEKQNMSYIKIIDVGRKGN